jgi:hypothetical protein
LGVAEHAEFPYSAGKARQASVAEIDPEQVGVLLLGQRFRIVYTGFASVG